MLGRYPVFLYQSSEEYFGIGGFLFESTNSDILYPNWMQRLVIWVHDIVNKR